jgi:hypothetical protein
MSLSSYVIMSYSILHIILHINYHTYITTYLASTLATYLFIYLLFTRIHITTMRMYCYRILVCVTAAVYLSLYLVIAISI